MSDQDQTAPIAPDALSAPSFDHLPAPPAFAAPPSPMGPPAPTAAPGALPPPPPPQASDPNVLWEGERNGLGLGRCRYRITREYVMWESGVLSTNAEQVPLWAVHGVDAKQSMTQKSRGVGDVILNLEPNNYTQARPFVTLESINEWRFVCDLLLRETERVRRERYQFRNTQTINQNTQMVHQALPPPQWGQGPPPPGTPAMPPAPAIDPSTTAPHAIVSVADELRKLAELRDLGVLSEDEFAAQKARLLGG